MQPLTPSTQMVLVVVIAECGAMPDRGSRGGYFLPGELLDEPARGQGGRLRDMHRHVRAAAGRESESHRGLLHDGRTQAHR